MGADVFVEHARSASLQYDDGDFVTLKTAFENLSATGLSWYPDSHAALVCGNESGRPSRCYRVALDGTPAEAVTPDGVVEGLVISEGRVLGRRADDSFEVYPPSARGGPPQKVLGLTNKDMLIGWNTKDRRVYAGQPANPLRIDSIDIQTGQRRLIKTLTPPNRAGVLSIDNPVTLVNDGEFYSYRYSQMLSTLYVVKGAAPLVGIR